MQEESVHTHPAQRAFKERRRITGMQKGGGGRGGRRCRRYAGQQQGRPIVAASPVTDPKFWTSPSPHGPRVKPRQRPFPSPHRSSRHPRLNIDSVKRTRHRKCPLLLIVKFVKYTVRVMHCSFHSNSSLSPYSDALDTGSNKAAIVACTKLLKKQPNNDLAKVCTECKYMSSQYSMRGKHRR